MKLVIRKSTFETNSSSTHSMIIPKELKKSFLKAHEWDDFIFRLGYFGRPCKTIKANQLDYLYTCVVYYALYHDGHDWEDYKKSPTMPQKVADKITEMQNHIIKVLEDHRHFGYIRFEIVPWEDAAWCDEPYFGIPSSIGIDHFSDGAEEFIEALFSDDELLYRYLLAGKVYVGSDEASTAESAKVNRDEPTCFEYIYHDEYDYDDPRRYEEHEYTNPHYLGDDWENKYTVFKKGN